jgi:serine/threonine-protein kinase
VDGLGGGRYEVQSEIAVGGMGQVFRVRDRATGEERALKRVIQTGPKQHFILEAFEREYQVLASLDHPRIVRVFDYGVDAQGPYYTMELIEGRDMRAAAPLPYRTACLYVRDVATSLALLHGRRLLHRDLSPSNVRLAPDGHCKLLDFGALAPFGASQQIVGTPQLIAPEMLQGAELDQRTDLYALGALAYWLLTGRHAYPVRKLQELFDAWTIAPAPPSSYAREIPAELDALVFALLHRDPLARPSSAAEVISRLDVIGELEPEDSTQSALLAQSFFASPRFTGRSEQLRTLSDAALAAKSGKGSALLVSGAPGMGRSRLLEELAIQARLSGATVLSVDASSTRKLQGTAQALVRRLFELLPDVARQLSARFATTLRTIGLYPEDLASELPPPEPPRPLSEFFAEASQCQPLVITVDNVEEADDASHGLLATLATLSDRHRLLLVAAEARTRDQNAGLGLHTLRRQTRQLTLEGLSDSEMTELLRSVFADAPNLERFAEFVQERTAGSPLHAMEVCRRLLALGVLRYTSGLWTLPGDRPVADLPFALNDALAVRLSALSDAARALAECLSLQRNQPTTQLCGLLCADTAEPELRARALLDELTRADVLRADRGAYRFSSSALRTALARGLDEERLEQDHRRLGDAFTRMAALQSDDLALRLEAGYHLIEGGEDLHGADIIATVANEPMRLRGLIVNMYRAGDPLETALLVYRRHRRSAYERMPLLAALAVAGYYESRRFAEQYGDEAVDLLEDLCGVRSAVRLRRYLGRALALIVGVLFAYLRFVSTPRRQRKYVFRELFVSLFSTVTALAGTAALSLDPVRAKVVARTLEPFAFLPERLTPVGIHQFCEALGEIALENEATAYATFQLLLTRFRDPRYYPTLPADGRELYLAALHFARGSFGVFRADGASTLESAERLDSTGYKLYAMIASQLRFLYYTARGEFQKAQPHHDQLELHAAHMGSVWQVETWEAAALILIHAVALDDVVGATRIVHRLEATSRSVPSLKSYSRLARVALIAAHSDRRHLLRIIRKYVPEDQPRSYIGWAATRGAMVRSLNYIGEYAEAKAVGDAALAHVTDADREFVTLFLPLDIEVAHAEAGLGQYDAALGRIDALLARFARFEHPLLQGMLHEARATICWSAKRVAEYSASLDATERWYRITGTPALIAKCERLVALAQAGKN